MSSTTVKLTPQDLLAAWRLQRRNNIAVRFSQWFPLLLAALYLLSSWRDLVQYGWREVLSDPILPGAIVLLAAMNYIIDKVTLPRNARRIAGQQKSLSGDIVYTWDAEALQVTAEMGHSRLAWNDFIKWLEDDTSLMFFQSDNLFNVLPKRVLDDVQVAEIRSYLTATLGKSGKKRKTKPRAA